MTPARRLLPAAMAWALAAACLTCAPAGAASSSVSAESGGRPSSPRYATSGPLALASSGAIVRDDFEGAAIDTSRWRTWLSDPKAVRLEQRDGRFWIHARGRVGYNGLASRADPPKRDVVAVCRAGVTSPGGALHAAILHLCGSGRFSPDHWFELRLRAAAGGAARATIDASIPPEHRAGYEGTYDLPPAGERGYLVKVVCEAAGNTCRGFVDAGGGWWQIGDAFEVPARRSHLEIKTSGPDKEGAATTIWFDDCRLYPRPENHYVTVVLQRPDGSPPGEPEGGGDRQVCSDRSGRAIPGCDFSVKLFAADGRTLVAETSTGAAFGYALLKLDRAPWDLYPVAAVLRVFALDRQLGPDHVLASRGVEGLYPDDVYTITLR